MKDSLEVYAKIKEKLEAGGLPLVFSVPHQGFVLKGNNGRWMTDCSVKSQAAEAHLTAKGWTTREAKTYLRASELWRTVYGFDLRPGATDIFEHNQHDWLNTWVPPTIEPKEGEFPTIEMVINWMAKDNQEAISWLTNWMAYKVQNPMAVPKVAVVFSTAPGAGKGFLARVLSEILGVENCAIVKQSELENRFNSRWIGKLFVLGDEVISSDNTKDISNYLKVLIDGNEQELEAKGVDQIRIKSKLAWMFASNDRVSPVILESNDRRYSFFANHTDMSEEYKKKLQDCFELDRTTYTPEFREEVAAFFQFLLQWPVDKGMLVRPLENDDRANLIEANKPSYEAFLDIVEKDGIDEMLEDVSRFNFGNDAMPKREEWDFAEKGFAVRPFFKLYQKFCRDTGCKSLQFKKFGQAIRNRGWERIQLYRPKLKPIGVYARTGAVAKDNLPTK